MQRVASTRPVLYVNSITMRMPLPGRSTMVLRRIVQKARSMMRPIGHPLPDLPGLTMMTPVFLPFYGSKLSRKLSARLVRQQVQRAARRGGIHKPLCVVTIPTAWEVVRTMPNAAVVYNRSDKHSAFTEAPQDYIRSLEEALLKHADLVVYVSRALMKSEAALTGDRAFFLDHGVDLEHFRPRSPDEEPADLRAIPHPRIGFYGGFDDYTTDLGLLERVAREIPHAQLVLIGGAARSMSRFESIPNVHWLEFRPYDDIPRYGSGFDVALMPWLRNEWIYNCNPIKLKEYLALGLSVVTTDFPEAWVYKDWLRIAGDADDFVAKVRLALALGGPGAPEDRMRAVAHASWDARAAKLIELAEEAAARRGRRPPALADLSSDQFGLPG
jgi:glycosyltransferase involved in cell wall biosynthesis